MSDPETQRTMAAALFNQAWELLDRPNREPDDDAEMLAAALGSWYHWHQVGEPDNHAMADWQVSRVLAALDEPQLARWYGERALRLCDDYQLGPFLTGYAHEAIARAEALSGEAEKARGHLTAATGLVGDLTDAEERALLDADLADIAARITG